MTTVNPPTKPTQIRMTRRSPAYWRVTIDNPPINVMGPEMVQQFQEVINALEADEHVRVVVFDSAVDDYFLNHSDFLAKLEDLTALPAGPTGLARWPDFLVRLTGVPVASIAPHPRPCDGQRQRDHARLRHEFRQPRKGHPLAMGGAGTDIYHDSMEQLHQCLAETGWRLVYVEQTSPFSSDESIDPAAPTAPAAARPLWRDHWRHSAVGVTSKSANCSG